MLLTANNLGLLYHNLGDYDKAKTFTDEALKVIKSFGKDHPMTLKCMGNLALVFNDYFE